MATEIKRTKAVWELDATKYNKSLQGINKQMQVAKSEFKLADSGLKRFGASTNDLAKKQQALQKQIELNKNKMDLYTKSLDKSNTKVKEAVTKRKELEKNLKDTEAAYKKVVAEQGKESKEAQKLQKELDSLKKEYKDNEKEIDNNTKKSANFQQQINKTATELNGLEKELEDVDKALNKSTSKIEKAQNKLNSFGDKAQKIGGGLNTLGNGILTVTTPMALGIAAATKQFMEFEKGIAKTGTIADSTKMNLEQIKNEIIALSNETGASTEDLNEAMYQAISAGVDTADTMRFLAEANQLAKGGFTSTTNAVDIMTTVLNAYGMEAEKSIEVSDMLITTQNLGKTSVDQLASSLGKVIPTAKASGVQFDQVSTSVALLTQKGIATSEAVTYLNSMINELGKSGTNASKELKKATGKTFQQLMKEGKSLGEVMAMLDEHAKKTGKGLGDMFGSAEAGKAALTIATNSGKDFNAVLKEMENSAGATSTAYEKMMNTKSENLNVSVNKLKNNFMKLGEAAVPLVDELAKMIGKLADFLGSLSDDQMKSIVNFVKWGTVLGVSSKALGGVVNTVGTLSKGLSKGVGLLGKFTSGTKMAGAGAKVMEGGAKAGAKGVASLGKIAGGTVAKSGGLGLLAKGVGTVAKFMAGPWGLAIGAGVLAVGTLGKALKTEVVPEVDLFANAVRTSADGTQTNLVKISDATKQVVGAYLELDEKATASLFNMYATGSTITAQTVKDLTSQYSQMGKTITAELDKDYKADLDVMNKFFADSTTLTAEEKAKALETLKTNNETEKQAIQEKENQIKTILDTASKENRSLKAEEYAEIQRLQNEMKTSAVTVLSEQEEEAAVILGRMKAYDGRMTAEMVGEHVKKLEESRIKSVDAANKEYRERMKVAENMKKNGGKEAEETANKLIKEAERQRDETIAAANEIKEEGLTKLEGAYGDLRQDVNTETGEILTAWGRVKNWWDNWNPFKKKMTVEVNRIGDSGYPEGKSRQVIQRNRNFDLTAYNPAKTFDTRLDRVRTERNTFDYARMERAITKLSDSMNEVISSLSNDITLDGRSIVKGTAKATDRELHRMKVIQEYGFR